MNRRQPISTRTDTLFPYTTLFRSILRGFVPFIATALSLTFLKAAGRFLIGSEQTRKVAPFCKQIGQSIGIKNTQESAQRLAQNPGQAAGGGNEDRKSVG